MEFSSCKHSTSKLMSRSIFLLVILCISKLAIEGLPYPSGDVPCTQLEQYLEQLSRGVDIASLDLLPLDSKPSNAFKSPVIDFSCNAANGWLDLDSQKYQQLPDQIRSFIKTEPQIMKTGTHVFRNSEDVKTKMADNFGLKLVDGMFSRIPDFEFMIRLFMNDSIVADSFGSVPLYEVQLDFSNKLRLSNIAANDLNRANGSYQNNSSIYDAFVEKFGTHYFTSASFGLHIRDFINMSKLYQWNHNQAEVLNLGQELFLKWIQDTRENETLPLYEREFSYSKGYMHSKDFFTKGYTENKRSYGGFEVDLKRKSFRDWVQNGEIQPWLYGGKLAPVYELLHEDGNRIAMKTAVEKHLGRLYLQEMEKNLKFYSEKFLDRGKNVVEDLLLRTREQIDARDIDVKDLKKIANEFKNNFLSPDWWKQTVFCYDAYPDNSKNRCIPYEPFCAKVNDRTGNLHDKSIDIGGYYIRWGIHSNPSQTPDWFRSLKFCFKYSPRNVSGAGQCGNGEMMGSEFCSGLNENTTYYHDHSDSRPGSCELSWKISVPDLDSVPVWFQRVKFCFGWSWFSPGVGWGDDKLFCAYLNDWTEGYWDDTYFYSSANYRYARMHWSLTDRELLTW